ncbi:hypothetical protein HPP92_024849 [Vanilla planifolia]|uniref:Methyltransferase type 11 domain-containing protein n=1 Tax=Vanilla planifolia TaxID=51239 RepID=A0A835PGS7_VANPL|nr:hypothetical protein HPP92_024849 [Vanilla planifolia]
MEFAAKPTSVRGLIARLLLFGVFILLFRFVYVVTLRGGSCASGDFCFFPSPSSEGVPGGISAGSVVSPEVSRLWRSSKWRQAVEFYSAVFQDLVVEGFLSPAAKSLCLDTHAGHEVFALKEIGIADVIGISKKNSSPLVIAGDLLHLPFGNSTVDFIFADGSLDRTATPAELAGEIARVLKPEGFLVILTASAGDLYSLYSLEVLFACCKKVRSREIDGPDSLMSLREIVFQKIQFIEVLLHKGEVPEDLHPAIGGESVYSKCSIPEHKLRLLSSAEPLIEEEPQKPWITLKKNIKNIKYLPSLVDISFKRRYFYIDVGARSYGSSIGSWFKKQYPKQNRTFHTFAIEADQAFHAEYATKKGITLLPLAAWICNESIPFEVNHDPEQNSEEHGHGMGRIKSLGASMNSSSLGNLHKVQGFDFAEWLKSIVSEKDFVVMKMDVEGTEFDLIPRLFETGAICLIDELFLECHYNRWQRCCPGKRSPKYQNTYGQCIHLFSSLRENGILVHQWW